MSHDAQWFLGVAKEHGMQAVNRLSQIAGDEIGKVEAQTFVRASKLPAVTPTSDHLLAQEVFTGLFGPGLLDHDGTKVGEDANHIHVRRCLSSENEVRTGIVDYVECGAFARVTAWLNSLGLEYEMTPSSGKCLKVKGGECVCTLGFKAESPLPDVPVKGYEWPAMTHSVDREVERFARISPG